MNYYYTTNGSDVEGPYSLAEIKKFVELGAISPSTQVCPEGQESWQSLSSIIGTSSSRREVIVPKRRVETPPASQRNPLLIPLIVLVILFVVAAAGGAFYFGRKSAAPQVVLAPSPAPTPIPTPVAPTPPPKPTISEDTRTRVLNFIEKAGKLSSMTEQGVAFTPFRDQLAEVKSSWQTLTLVSWPDTWNRERANFESAMDGWSIAIEMWERKIRLSSDPGDKLEYLLHTGDTYRPRLQAYAETVARRTEDDSVMRKFNMVVLMRKTPDEKPGLFNPDIALQWCFSTASFSFEKGRDGIKSQLAAQ